MDWNALMSDIEADIGSYAKDVPDTMKGFGTMGAAAKQMARWMRKPRNS